MCWIGAGFVDLGLDSFLGMEDGPGAAHNSICHDLNA